MFLFALVVASCTQNPTSTTTTTAAPTAAVATDKTSKAPSAQTLAANASLVELDFADKQDFDDAKRGFIAKLPDVVKNDKGEIVFDAKSFEVPLDQAAPDTVNPSQWRQTQLNGISGLFKVVDRIYQVRGLDLSNITFIEGNTGIIVIDPLISVETAKAALDLYYANRPKKPVVAVIHTHSHVDHFGGVRGVTNENDVRAGRTKIIAPAGFTEEAVSENVMAGNAMSRRAMYQYGHGLAIGPRGTLGTGLGKGTSSGEITLIPPTDVVTKTGQKMTIDGLAFEFLLAPNSEAPSEMHFYIPELKALTTAENAVDTLHNFYTLRGAKTRDVTKWVGYLNDTLDKWGDKAEVLYAPHSWPKWGNEHVVRHIENYRDAFRYIHDQSLRLANEGYTMSEIAEMVRLPPALAKNWATRGYYGSVKHDAKAVYNFYLGYYSSNPADLDALPPSESAKHYVALMGGEDAVVKAGKDAFEKGDYRWAAELMKQVVYANPSNQAARNIQADAFEQLGYQAENATWRNEYLMGARELREGMKKESIPQTDSPDLTANIPIDLFFDYLALRLNGPKAAGQNVAINFDFTDVHKQVGVTLRNGVLNHRAKPVEKPDATFSMTTRDFGNITSSRAKIADLVKDGTVKTEGDPNKLGEMLANLDTFDPWFGVITPNPPR
jgi:alkyl sulfatase BDS1-like metallo-beta-lactamase superfamily hydrolase